ncbi:MAG: endolytic transglycosylase MltG [Minisyncoccia bacterium]
MFSALPKNWRIHLAALGAVLFLILVFALSAPRGFPEKSLIVVKEGTDLFALSRELSEARVIRSPFWFRALAILMGGERDMKAGEYFMDRPQSSLRIAWRILYGRHGIETIKLTVPEGFTIEKISNLFDGRFGYFNKKDFKELAQEGFMFPDTYFVPITATASSTVKMFSDNFERRLEPLLAEIAQSGRTLDEIIKMASILEGEAKSSEDMRIVSGILWKRLDNDIALQVDTSFAYINGKTTKELTAEDLKIKSPYNSYLYRGLPPTPISNPGLESIRAALSPTTTPYLYFLTGDDGAMYYSRTFDEHVEKKRRLIR